MFLIFLLTSSTLTKPLTFPINILQQFPDYDLLLHFDNTTSKFLDFLPKKNQPQHLINYDTTINIKKKRPQVYKCLNLVILQDPLSFQIYSRKPYSFHPLDLVFFIIPKVQEEIWKLPGLQQAAGIYLYETINSRMYSSCYYCGNNTGILQKTKITNLPKLINNYSNFHDHLFRIAFINFPPFIIKHDNDTKAEGSEGKMLDEFSKLYKFRYELIQFRQNHEIGAWSAMIEAVKRNKIDWAIGGITVSLNRGNQTDFTRFIKTQGFAVAYRVYQSSWSHFDNLLLVFDYLSWFLTFFTILIVCLIAKFVSNLLSYRVNFYRFFQLSVRAVIEQPVSIFQFQLIQFTTLRFLFIIWWLICLSITTMYKSQLTSTLIQPKYYQHNKIDDLVKKRFWFFVNHRDWSALKENLETSSDLIYSKILSHVRNDLDFCQSIWALQDGKFAVIDEETPLQYNVYKRCKNLSSTYRSSLRLVTEDIFPNLYHAWCMPPGTPFRLKFSKTIGKMNDYGLIDYWYKSSSNYRLLRSKSPNFKQLTSSLTLQQILPIILVLIVGYLLSILIFLIEINVKKLSKWEQNFSGEERESEINIKTQNDAYDELQNAFIKKLNEVREDNESWLEDSFPFWDEKVIDLLHNNYLLLASEDNGMLDFTHFCWFLDSLQDTSSQTYRLEKYNEMDTNKRGFITIDEFLVLVYNYNNTENSTTATGLAKTCLNRTETINLINQLSITNQLKNNLF